MEVLTGSEKNRDQTEILSESLSEYMLLTGESESLQV